MILGPINLGRTLPITGWRIEEPGVILEGDGPLEGNGLLRLGCLGDDPRQTGGSDGIVVAAHTLTLRDLCISNGLGPASGTGCGIVHRDPVTLWGLVISRVGVLYCGWNGLRLAPSQPARGSSYHVGPSIRDSSFYGCSGPEGVFCYYTNFATFDHVTSTRHPSAEAPTGRGFTLVDCGTPYLRVVAENVRGGILLKNVIGGVIECAHIEQFAGAMDAPPEPGVILDNCRGVTVRGGVFEDWSARNPTGILLRNGTTACTIGPNFHAGVALTVDDGGCRGNTIHRQTWPEWHPKVEWKVSSKRNTVIG